MQHQFVFHFFLCFLLLLPYQSFCVMGFNMSSLWANLLSTVSSSRCNSSANVMCKNSGTCMDQTESPEGFICVCAPGFDGLYCQYEKDDCANHKCPKGASCVDQIGHYTCKCAEGYVGDQCQYKDKCKENNPCLYGKCITNPKSGNAECECINEYFGPRCQYEKHGCTQNPCQNGGTCMTSTSDKQCKCPFGFDGIICEKCAPGFSGPFCISNTDQASNLCKTLNCINGQCQLIDKFPKCQCFAGFTGNQCELAITNCHNNPCLNDGQCVEDGSSYLCQCSKEYTGSNCEKKLHHPCLRQNTCNFGTCYPIGTSGAYTCLCPDGVSGQFCDRLLLPHATKNCDYERCLAVVNNGFCDTACHRSGCHLDVVDCDPYARCRHPEYCRTVAKNDVCDPVCDTSVCLFDGGDCVNQKLNDCSETCFALRSNGVCNSECDTEKCGFDGSDCFNSSLTDSAEMITVQLAENPNNFRIMKLKEFVTQISTFIGAPVGLSVSSDGSPAVYAWTPKTGRISLINLYSIDDNAKITSEAAIEIELLVDFYGCNTSKTCRFVTCQEIVEYITSETLMDVVSETGFAIFKAYVPVQHYSDFDNLTIFIGFIIFAYIFAIIFWVLLKFYKRQTKIEESVSLLNLHDLLRMPNPLNSITPALFAGISSVDEHGQSTLHAAVNAVATKKECDIIKDVRLLLASGLVSINHQDNIGFTPLHYAVKKERFAVAHLLLTEGASPNIAANDRTTILYHAVEKEDVRFLLLLLAHRGIEVNAAINGNDTALKYCIRFGERRMKHFNALLSHPEIDINAIGDGTYLACRKQTVVHETIYWGNANALKALIKCGADLAPRDYCGRTPLAMAIESEKIDLAEMLLKHLPANKINIGDDCDITPAIIAYKKGYTKLSQSIIQMSMDGQALFQLASFVSSLVSTSNVDLFNNSMPKPMPLVRKISNLSISQSFDSDSS